MAVRKYLFRIFFSLSAVNYLVGEIFNFPFIFLSSQVRLPGGKGKAHFISDTREYINPYGISEDQQKEKTRVDLEMGLSPLA